MRENWTKMDILQHVRHDWLNRIQLIKGNLALGKTEHANRIIEDIVIDMQQEAKLTNLGLPELAFLLMSHNWGGYPYAVEYEIPETLLELPVVDREVSNWVRQLFEKLNEKADPVHDNRLSVLIGEEKGLARFVFYFDGILEDIGGLEDWLAGDEAVEEARIERKSGNETIIEVFFKRIGV